MDKSKLIAIVALVLGIGLIAVFKEKPLPPDDDDDHHDAPAEQAKPPSKEDVAKLSGGITELQKKDVVVGTGAVAKAGDNVAVNYRGTLLNGEVFDQSKGAPFTFQLGTGGVIKGWDEGVAGMKVGGKRQLVIPADKAYGAAGSPPKIPGGATLKFDVELLQVNGKK